MESDEDATGSRGHSTQGMAQERWGGGKQGSRGGEAELGWEVGGGMLSTDRRQAVRWASSAAVSACCTHPKSLDPGHNWSQGGFLCVELRARTGK